VKNIIILGAGFVGSNLFNHLALTKKYNVGLISRKELDYFDEISLKKYIRNFLYSDSLDPVNDIILINCSGYTGIPNVDTCETNKEICLQYNTQLPVFLSNFVKNNNAWLINVSSGCIFSGYEKHFTEEDIPNFGIYNNESSFYSKCKHLTEVLCNKTKTSLLRIRMPFCNFSSPRSIINKILNYNNLISFDNSVTSLEDMSIFIEKFIDRDIFKNTGIFNVTNEGYINAKVIVELLSKYNHINPNWKFVDLKDLDLKAQRSNCILSTDKIRGLGLELPTALNSIEHAISCL
jgi:dTDP-4-dehydrorhamnose reductase